MQRYNRVPTDESSEGRRADDSSRRRESIERVTVRAHALLWVVGAVLVARYTAIFHVVAADPRVHSFFLQLAVAALCVCAAVFVYLVIYLPYIARITLPWDVYCPKMIPTATLAGVVAALW